MIIELNIEYDNYYIIEYDNIIIILLNMILLLSYYWIIKLHFYQKVLSVLFFKLYIFFLRFDTIQSSMRCNLWSHLFSQDIKAYESFTSIADCLK